MRLLIFIQRLVRSPTEADWERWEPLAAHTEVYRDQSYDGAYGIETDDCEAQIIEHSKNDCEKRHCQ